MIRSIWFCQIPRKYGWRVGKSLVSNMVVPKGMARCT